MAAGVGTYPLQNFSNTSPTHYPFINAHSDSPPYHITKYLPSTVHTTAAHTPSAYSQTTHQIHPTIPLSEFHTHTALLTHLTKPNMFNNFLNTWAQNQDNPSLLKPPPSFHLSPSNTQAQPFKTTTNSLAATKPTRPTSPQHTLPYSALQISHAEPVHSSPNSILPAQQSYPKTNHKISSHTHSRFKPYFIVRPPSTMGFLSQQHMPLPSQQPLISEPITSIHLANLHPYCNSPSLPQHHKKPFSARASMESFSPQSSPNSTISYTLPAIISKSKGKTKMSYDDDDVPLALLKKQRLDSTDYYSPLSDVEVAAISLTNLQHATPIRGPVYDFLNTPLLGTPVRPSDMKFPVAAHCIPDHLQQQLQSKSSLQTCHPNPSPMDLQPATPSPAYVANLFTTPVAATKVSHSCRFIRANRGRCNNSSTAAGTTTLTSWHIINQEERRVRPPLNA
jgi:hypothetical protein